MAPHDDFELLLIWLGGDRDRGALAYESLRRRLVRYFAGRGCHEAEEQVDIVFDRVLAKIRHLTDEYEGVPARYFYGVARLVLLEWIRTQGPKPDPPPSLPPNEIDELRHDCLEKCLGELPEPQRELVLNYYQQEKRAKIEHRKAIAQHLGITINALHIRICRIVRRLEDCTLGCLAEAAS